jgi:hypothetical protein
MDMFLCGLLVGAVLAIAPRFVVIVKRENETLNVEYKGVMYWLKPMRTELERNDK